MSVQFFKSAPIKGFLDLLFGITIDVKSIHLEI